MKAAAAARLKKFEKVQREIKTKPSPGPDRDDGNARAHVQTNARSFRVAIIVGAAGILLAVVFGTREEKRAIGRGASSLPPPLGAGQDFVARTTVSTPAMRTASEKPKKGKSRKVQILERLQNDPEDLDALTDLCDLYDEKFPRERNNDSLEDIVSCHGAVIDVLTQKEQPLNETNSLLAIISADRVLSLAQGKSDRLQTAVKGLALSLGNHTACDAQSSLFPFGKSHARSCVRAAKKLRSASAMLGEEPPVGIWSFSSDVSSTPLNFQLPLVTAKPTWMVSEIPWLAEISGDLRSAILDEWPVLVSRKASELTLTTGGFQEWSTHTLLINGEWDKDLCGLCPRVCGLLKERRELNPKNAQLPAGVLPPELVVLFFLLSPGGRVLPHFGTHGRLVASLGVESFESSELLVGGAAPKWSRDEFMIFDDAFEHSVVNRGTDARVVFSMTFVHPELLKQPA